MDHTDPNNHGGSATTDEQGKFTVSDQDKNGGGLAAGEYSVTFSQTLVNGKPIIPASLKKGATSAGQKEGVPEEYRDAAKTPVKITVGKDTQSFQFEVKK